MTCPLRVLIGADTCPPDINGAARFTTRLAAGLARRKVIGAGARYAAWSALAGDLGQAGRVRFLGAVDDDAHVAAYRRCSVFRIPGIAELRSLVALQTERSPEPEKETLEAVGCSRLPLPGENSWAKSRR